VTYTLYYISADGPEPDSTWSVWREQYESIEHETPIEGTAEHVSQHATEAEADAEAVRLQVRSYATPVR